MSDLAFWLLAGLLLAFASGVVLARNLWRAAYCLAGALLVTATFYLLLTAPLVAAVQILLYTGGVLTLVAYALVMTARTDDPSRWRRPWPAAAVALLVFAALASGVRHLEGAGAAGGLGDARALGLELFSRYLVPFELLSFLLLGAIFGALTIARKDGPP